MGIKFPSPEWTAAFKDAINANPGYAQAGKEWTHGKVAYIVKARPEIGIERDMAMVLDLHAGTCREAQMTTAEDARQADFVIVAEYERWKEVLSGAVDPTKAMMQNKLKLEKGHLPTIVKFVVASKELVRSAATIDTDYPA
ncbi:MAG TPA: SCP2 sterol-binding domain-containing protein [Sandaracinaceae bacterium]